MKYKIILYLNIFINFSLVNSLSLCKRGQKSKIDEECLDHIELDCSNEEREYYYRILRKQLIFLGNFKYLELYEFPCLKVENENLKVMAATLAIYNGYVWDYSFVKVKLSNNQYILHGYRRRRGHCHFEEVNPEVKEQLFGWLTSKLYINSACCIL